MALTKKNTYMNLTYCAESPRGSVESSGSLYRVSDGLDNVNLVGRNNGEIVYSIYDYDGQGTIFGLEEYVLTFDYYLQRTSNATHPLTKTIEYHALTRSAGDLTTLQFYLSTDSDSTYRLNEGVINSWSMTPEEKRLKCSCEVLCKKYAIADDVGHTAAQAIGTTFEQFQSATLTRSGSIEAGVGGFTININNNADRIPVMGSSTASVYESFENLGGTVDILLNDGGDNDFAEMQAETKASVVFASGAGTGVTDQSMKWTFANASYSEFPIPLASDTRVVISGVNWIAETVALASVT